MTAIRRLFLLALFCGVPLFQGLHRHPSHAPGLSQDHVDCTACPWARDVHGTPLVGAAPDLRFFLQAFFVENVSVGGESRRLLRAFDSRAPPSLLL
jgi:hypothetical protein